jgi:1-acyl-sn-glycerol-3-phosphate acyltransferase
MNVLSAISPGLKVLFERVGKPEIVNQPALFQSGGAGAVIACNHVGWADSLWMAYALYPRQLHYMSKEELFNSTLSRWVLTYGGSLPIDRADPSPSSIKTAVDMLRHGEIILIFPSGTRSEENIAFKRGAATIALHARVPLVPAYFQGPKQIQVAHLLHRPPIQVNFGSPIPTTDLPLGKRNND